MNFQQILDGRTKDLDSTFWSYKLAGNYGQSGPLYGLDAPMLDPKDMQIDESTMSMWIPIADGNRRDGVGDLLEVAGINTERHYKNPIILFDHAKSVSLPIGRAREKPDDPATYTFKIDPVARTAGCRAYFYQGKSDGEHSLFCDQLFDMVVKGFIRAGSIGYSVQDATPLQPDYQRGIPQGMHLKRILMLECSLVVLPASQDTVGKALGLGKVCGSPLSPVLRKSLEKFAPAKKAQLGYEQKAAHTTVKPMNKVDAAEIHHRHGQGHTADRPYVYSRYQDDLQGRDPNAPVFAMGTEVAGLGHETDLRPEALHRAGRADAEAHGEEYTGDKGQPGYGQKAGELRRESGEGMVPSPEQQEVIYQMTRRPGRGGARVEVQSPQQGTIPTPDKQTMEQRDRRMSGGVKSAKPQPVPRGWDSVGPMSEEDLEHNRQVTADREARNRQVGKATHERDTKMDELDARHAENQKAFQHPQQQAPTAQDQRMARVQDRAENPRMADVQVKAVEIDDNTDYLARAQRREHSAGLWRAMVDQHVEDRDRYDQRAAAGDAAATGHAETAAYEGAVASRNHERASETAAHNRFLHERQQQQRAQKQPPTDTKGLPEPLKQAVREGDLTLLGRPTEDREVRITRLGLERDDDDIKDRIEAQPIAKDELDRRLAQKALPGGCRTVPIPHGDLSQTHIPPPRATPGWVDQKSQEPYSEAEQNQDRAAKEIREVGDKLINTNPLDAGSEIQNGMRVPIQTAKTRTGQKSQKAPSGWETAPGRDPREVADDAERIKEVHDENNANPGIILEVIDWPPEDRKSHHDSDKEAGARQADKEAIEDSSKVAGGSVVSDAKQPPIGDAKSIRLHYRRKAAGHPSHLDLQQALQAERRLRQQLGLPQDEQAVQRRVDLTNANREEASRRQAPQGTPAQKKAIHGEGTTPEELARKQQRHEEAAERMGAIADKYNREPGRQMEAFDAHFTAEKDRQRAERLHPQVDQATRDDAIGRTMIRREQSGTNFAVPNYQQNSLEMKALRIFYRQKAATPYDTGTTNPAVGDEMDVILSQHGPADRRWRVTGIDGQTVVMHPTDQLEDAHIPARQGVQELATDPLIVDKGKSRGAGKSFRQALTFLKELCSCETKDFTEEKRFHAYHLAKLLDGVKATYVRQTDEFAAGRPTYSTDILVGGESTPGDPAYGRDGLENDEGYASRDVLDAANNERRQRNQEPHVTMGSREYYRGGPGNFGPKYPKREKSATPYDTGTQNPVPGDEFDQYVPGGPVDIPIGRWRATSGVTDTPNQWVHVERTNGEDPAQQGSYSSAYLLNEPDVVDKGKARGAGKAFTPVEEVLGGRVKDEDDEPWPEESYPAGLYPVGASRHDSNSRGVFQENKQAGQGSVYSNTGAMQAHSGGHKITDPDVTDSLLVRNQESHSPQEKAWKPNDRVGLVPHEDDLADGANPNALIPGTHQGTWVHDQNVHLINRDDQQADPDPDVLSLPEMRDAADIRRLKSISLFLKELSGEKAFGEHHRKMAAELVKAHGDMVRFYEDPSGMRDPDTRERLSFGGIETSEQEAGYPLPEGHVSLRTHEPGHELHGEGGLHTEQNIIRRGPPAEHEKALREIRPGQRIRPGWVGGMTKEGEEHIDDDAPTYIHSEQNPGRPDQVNVRIGDAAASPYPIHFIQDDYTYADPNLESIEESQEKTLQTLSQILKNLRLS